MLDWAQQFLEDTAQVRDEEEGGIALGCDNHGAQQTTAFKDKLRQASTMLAYTPPGWLNMSWSFTSVLSMIDCTDCISPCDHHLGVRLKELMSWFYHAEFRRNKASWIRGDLGASDRRILMAQWAFASWTALRLDSQRIKSAFVHTGFLLSKDGSEDHLISIPGISEYKFRD